MRSALVVLALAGCGGESLAPAPAAGAGGQSAVAATTGAGGSAKVIRTVVRRNPYGDVQKSDNLLWDGDFEWLSSFSDQYGWLTGSGDSLGYALPKQVVGARCKSGVKCAELAPGGVLVAVGVASKGNGLAASVYVAAARCEDVEVVVGAAFDETAPAKLAAEAAEDGWCHFVGAVPERPVAPWLYLRDAGPSAVLVDDASLEPMATKALATRAHGYGWLVRQLRERAKPSPRPRSEAERRFLAELARRRAQ